MRRVVMSVLATALAAGTLSVVAAPATATDPTPYLDAVTLDVPAAHWRLDETGNDTTLHDATSNGRNGTFTGSPTQGKSDALFGEAGTAVGFNGSSQYASVAANAAFQTGSATVEAWFRSTGTGGQTRYLYNRGGTNGQTVLGIDSSLRLFGAVKVGGVTYTVTGTTEVVEGRWHHAVLTHDGSLVKLFLDGQQAASATAAGTLDAYAGYGPSIGHASNSSGFRFSGDLDEIAVYGYPLTPSRIAAHYTAAGSRAESCDGTTAYQDLVCDSDPMAYYPLDGNATDLVTPANSGTYDNGTTTGTGAVYTEPTRVAARLDGVNDRVTAPYEPYGRYAVTRGSAEAWFRLTTFTTSDRYVVTRGGSTGSPLMLAIRNGAAYGRVLVGGTGYDLVGTTKIDDRAWHHLAVTYDGAAARLYVDGTQEATASATGALPYAVNAPIAIGYATNSSAQTGGDVDEVALYDHALTAGEVAARVAAAGTRPYSCTGAGAYSEVLCDAGPVGYWSLDEATGATSAADRTSYANAGAPQNAWQFGRAGIAGNAAGITAGSSNPSLHVAREAYGAYDIDKITVEGWVKFGTSPPWFDVWFMHQMRNSQVWAIGTQGTNAQLIAQLRTRDGVVHRLVAPATVLGNWWTHVALTYDGSVIRLYAHGAVVASKAYTGLVERCYDVGGCVTSFGVPSNTGTSSWPTMTLDEIAMYDRALSPGELADHWAIGVPPEMLAEQSYGPTGSGAYAENPTGCCGDPVNTATGSFYDTWHDARVGGAGTTFDFARSYNSADTGSGPLGAGWTHSYQAGLSIAGNGDVTVRTASGQRIFFAKQTNGSYLGSTGVRAKLVKNGNGTYTLTTRDQETLGFDATGLLTSQRDRSGTGLTFTYTSGQLTGVTDAAGRTATLAYTGSLLTSVTLADLRHVDYAYTNGRLTGVTDLRGKTTTYAYDTAGRLASATDPLGHQPFRNTYDATTGRITAQLDQHGNQTTYAWDAATRTATVTDPRGGVTKHTYSAGRLLLRTVDPVGAVTRYTYDSDLNLASRTDPRGNRWAMTYDAAGNLLSRTAPAPFNHVETWTYNTRNDPLTAVDRRGKTTTYTYDSTGRPSTVTDRANGVTSFTYDTAGQVLTVVDPRNGTTTYTYDSAGNRTSEQTPLGNTTTWTYDSSGRSVSMVEPRGNVTGANAATYTTTWTYDASDHVTSETRPGGRTTTRTYDDNGRLATVTDPENGVTTYGYDAAGQVTTITWPDTTTTTSTYDATGNLTSSTTALGRTTTYGYDLAGRRTSMTTPRGNVTGGTPSAYTWTYGYDLSGNRTSVSHPAAGTTRVTYDALDRPVSTKDALGNTTAVGYDANGNPTTVTDPLTAVTTTAYDDLDRPVTVTDPLSKTTTTAYDAMGNRTSVTTPLGHVTTWTYDADQRMATVVEPRGNVTGANPAHYTTTIGYDAAGHVTSRTDALGNVVEMEYDAAGRLVAEEDPNDGRTEYAYDDLDRLVEITAPDLTTTTYAYDAVGNLVSRTDAKNHVTEYDYDDDRRLVEKTDPLARHTAYAYDAEGNVVTRETPLGTATSTTGDGTVAATYDALGRVATVDYSDGTPDVGYAYDLLGRLATMTDGAGSETYGYDAVGRLETVTRGTQSFAYDYDLAGRLTSRTYPDGTVVDQAWDDDGRLTSLTSASATTTLGYDVADRLTATTFPAAVGYEESRVYDRAGRLTEVATTAGSTVLSRYVRTLDSAGNPLTRTVTRGSVSTTDTYEYDDLDRLTKVCFAVACTNPGVNAIEYAYDAVGNRTAQDRIGANASTTTYAYDAADQLTSTSRTDALNPTPDVTTYTYDANGRQTAAGTRTFAWGLDDRLASTTDASVTTAYTYDGAGRRLTEATGGTVHTRYAWDIANGIPTLAVESDGSGTAQRRWVHGPEGVVSMRTGAGAAYYYGHDHVGSVTDVVDAAGAAEWSYDYDPFGTARTTTQVGTSPPANPLRYAGEHLDAATGHYHLRARQYDPALGRLLSADPMAPELDDPYVSAYLYAQGRPTLLTDPSGMNPFTAVVGGVWDAAKDVYHGLDTLVTNPTEIEKQLEQVYVENGEGWSGRLAVFNQFNPVYQVLDRGDRAIQAARCGNWREAVRQTTHVGLTVAPYAHAATRGTSVLGRLSRRGALTEGATVRPPSGGIPGLRRGWQGRLAENGKGWVWQRRGAPKTGAGKNADMMRVMDPTEKYPNGYVRFYNEHGQPIGLDGKTGPAAHTHIPRNGPGGDWPVPKGWGQ
ncbi:MAG TPA: LamG-like jellyroll fold domain-containing protein [Mycobacteriales bacterium]|jgi:RHS repeat-associated protein